MSTLAPTRPAGAVSQAVIAPLTWIEFAKMAAVSSSDPAHAPYLCAVNGNGEWSCYTTEAGQVVECLGFKFRGTCRHLSACHAQIAVIAPVVKPVPAARYCEWCTFDVARQCSCFCSEKCRAAAAAAERPSTPDEVAATEEMKADTFAALLNAQAVSAHRFVVGSATEIQCSRPDPLAGAFA